MLIKNRIIQILINFIKLNYVHSFFKVIVREIKNVNLRMDKNSLENLLVLLLKLKYAIVFKEVHVIKENNVAMHMEIEK